MDLFNPRILEAIRREVFTFCESTLATLTVDLDRAMDTTRHELGAGLEAGESYHKLNKRFLEIFDDPYRASRVAQTEATRAVHGGQFLLDKESGIVDQKQWLASSDACDRCLALAAKGAIPIDEPFYVDPKGGPYAVVMHPGLHPF